MTPKHLHLGFHLRGVRSAMIEAAQKDNVRLLIFRPVRLHSVLQLQQYILWFIQFGLQHNWTDMQTWSVLSFKHETSLCAVIPTVWNRALLGLPFSIHVQYIYISISIWYVCTYTYIYIYDMCVCIYIYRYVTNGFPELFFFLCVCVRKQIFLAYIS